MYALSNLLIVCWLFFIHFFFFHIGCEMVKRHGTSSRDSRSLSLLPTHLSLSLSLFRCRKLGIARWPHRKLHSLLEMYKSLAGYYKVGKETHRTSLFGRLTFFFIQQLAVTFIITSKKNTHHHNYRKTTKKKRTPLLPPQELCEKTTLEPCPQRQSKRMEEVHIVRKDLVHLRNYALKVVRSFFFFGVDFLFFFCVCVLGSFLCLF